MKGALGEEILQEGIEALFERLGAVKATKFLQMVSVSKGDTVREIETQTEKMTKDEVLKMIQEAKKSNPKLWEKTGLLY